MTRIRMAYFSPLNPLPTGISDYSEELLPELAEFADVDLFVNGYAPSNPVIRERFAIYDYAEFPARQAEMSYAINLYQMGNSLHHTAIYHMLTRYPGVVVLHDVVLHHFFLEMNAVRNNPVDYLREMAYNKGTIGIKTGLAVLRGAQQPPFFEYPLIGRIVDSGLATVVHNHYAQDVVKAQTGRLARIIPQHVIPPSQITHSERIAQRNALGIPPDAVVFGAFGHATPAKRLDVVLRAFRRLKALLPESYLLIVGRQSPDDWLSAIVDELGLRDSVVITGPVSMDRFLAAIAASDVCVNLRYPTAGETSASLLRIMAAGKPAIVSDVGWFSELPDDCCFKIPVDASEITTLYQAMRDLAAYDSLRVGMGTRSREFVLRQHSIRQSVERYIGVIEETIENARFRRVSLLDSATLGYHAHDRTTVLSKKTDATEASEALRTEIESSLAELGLL